MTGSLPPTSYVVLGLVSVRPTTGHDLAAFAERSIGQFFSLTRSHVYSELDRLCRLGLLDVTEIEQERFPAKRVYEMTEEGEAVLAVWLDESEFVPERQRNLFLVRIFFGDRMSHARMEALLDSYERGVRARRDASPRSWIGSLSVRSRRSVARRRCTASRRCRPCSTGSSRFARCYSRPGARTPSDAELAR